MLTRPKIFFSYAWEEANEVGEGREKLINALYLSLAAEGYEVVRDKNNLGYKGFISEFMRDIGEGDVVVVAISPKYSRSPYCMFELYEIARNSGFDKYRFRERILPVFVEPINLASPHVIEATLQYWESEMETWNRIMRERTEQLSAAFMVRYDRVRQVYHNCNLLTEWLIDMNYLNPQVLSQDNFKIIKAAIQGHRSTLQRENPLPIKQELTGTASASNMRQTFILSNIRKLLMESLDDTDLISFCMDYFPEVQNRFGNNMDKSQKINILLDHCNRREALEHLLVAMQERDKFQFDRHQPYYSL